MKVAQLFKQVLILCSIGVLTAGTLVAQDLPDPMTPRRLVNDFAGVFTPQQQHALEQKLVAFDRKTSTQIAIVTVDDLDGYAPSEYAQRLYDQWGVGQKGKDNGLLILIKPKTQDSNGEVFIAVGYGLEGVVPDITAGRICDQEMLPSFRKGDYYTGTDRAVNVLMQLTEGEFTADQYGRHGAPQGMTTGAIVFIVLVALFLLFGRNRGGRGGDDGNNDGSNGGRRFVWIPPVFMGGHGGFSGGSSGGFGGFGGGMSGGGGGGRSW